MAVLFNYGCHTVTMGTKFLGLSPVSLDRRRSGLEACYPRDRHQPAKNLPSDTFSLRTNQIMTRRSYTLNHPAAQDIIGFVRLGERKLQQGDAGEGFCDKSED